MPPVVLAPRAALLDQGQCLDERLGVPVVLGDPGRHGEHVRVEDDVLRGEPGRPDEQVVGPSTDGHLPLGGVGLAQLVEGHHDHAGAEVVDPPGLGQERVLALLEADRVDHALALHAPEPGLEHAPAGAVDHDGDPGDLGLGRDQVEERGHRPFAVEQVGVHVHVEQVGAAAHLLERDVHRALVVVGLDQPAEPGGAGDVGPLTDHDEAGVGSDLERLQAAEPGPLRWDRDDPGRLPGDRGRDLGDVGRRRAAAAADDVDHAGLGELAEQPGGLGRGLVVATERVGQPGVRVAGDERVGQPGQLGHVRAHLGRAERAVHPDDQRVRVRDRAPERLDRLPGQRASAEVDE